MSDHRTTKTIIEILLMLSSNINYTPKEIAEKKGISIRTFYRYINTLKEIGFIIDKKENYFKIEKKNSYYKNISDLLHFSEEENIIISKAINSISGDNLLKQNLLKKLSSIYDFDRVAYSICDTQDHKKIDTLTKAIKTKKQAILKKYKSNNSNTVNDRLVEPFEFTNNYVSVWCYDISDNKCKTFKTARIKEVNITETNFKNTPFHKKSITDAFRNSGNKEIQVQLILSLRAKNLLEEEYPLSSKYITPNNNKTYKYAGWVTRYQGIGRFIMGLIEEIKIESPIELQDYINKKIENKFTCDTI